LESDPIIFNAQIVFIPLKKANRSSRPALRENRSIPVSISELVSIYKKRD